VLKDKQIVVQRKKRKESRPIDKINKSNEHSIDERSYIVFEIRIVDTGCGIA
jgi:2-polyprenyl-3-methyl-5-hydroxy-6-metoxy-1,4-benzoquinol methylase